MDLRTLSDNQVIAELRLRAKAERLRQNISQADMAERTGLGIHTVRRFEASASEPSLTTFISIVRALNDINSLDGILEEPPIDPVAHRPDHPEQQRSSRVRKPAPGGWVWGDER